MTATNAVADELVALGRRDDQARDTGPRAEAPEEVQAAVIAASRRRDLDLNFFFSVIAAAQIAWIAALGYGLFRLLA
jgi:hypothetical protein